jgi:intein/homing endonuclease
VTIVAGGLKEKVLKRIKQGRSLNKISNEFGLNKTTVFYWYRKLGKSNAVKVKIQQNYDDELVGEFIGIFAGDGCYYVDKKYHHSVMVLINAKDKLYTAHVKSLISELFSKEPYVFIRKKGNVAMIRIDSKDIYLFIKSYLEWTGKKSHSVGLKKSPKDYTNDFLRGFVRGLFDTDGFIDRTVPRAVFGTVSKHLAKNMEEVLSLLGINYTKNVVIDKRGNRKPLIMIEIFRSQTNRLLKLINPVH